MQINKEKLFTLAVAARNNAYTPYSKFKVGAALQSANGKFFSGCNVENASYGLTCCAERNTISTAIATGETEFICLLVVADTKDPVSPCGACRQVISEFKIPKIILTNISSSSTKTFTYNELLPYDFNADVF